MQKAITQFVRNYKIMLAFSAGIVLMLFASTLYHLLPVQTVGADEMLAECEQYTESPRKLDCWYQVMRTVHNTEGTAAAFEVFNTLYEHKPMFVETGCHLHAHRIGDFSYFDSYLETRDLEQMEFPAGSQVCGYGFYHGFFEHLIQDNPNTEYVKELCDRFDARLSSSMPAMRITCFHGSGHGFALAEIDEGDMGHWGDYEGIIKDPLLLCGELDARPNEQEECRQGVFTILVQWMETGEYGLSYDWEDPFWLCEKQSEINKKACYKEVGQKMDGVSNWNIDNALAVLADIPDQQYVGMLLHTMLASSLQRTITTDTQFDYMERCATVRSELQEDCVRGVVAGLMEHGMPGEEHMKAIEICSVDFLTEEQRSICFNELENRLKKFHSNERIQNICETNDSGHFRAACQHYRLEA